MSQKKDVYVASTFWLNHCSQELGLKEMLRCDFHKYEKFVFPVHCPGHWWCVLIDRPMKLYREFDSLCKEGVIMFFRSCAGNSKLQILIFFNFEG